MSLSLSNACRQNIPTRSIHFFASQRTISRMPAKNKFLWS
jgi:hypothetical protein